MSRQQFRIRTLEQPFGQGYQRLWDSNILAPNIDSANKDLLSVPEQFTFYSTRTLGRLKKTVTGSGSGIGESVFISSGSKAFVKPLNSRKSLSSKKSRESTRRRPRSPFKAHTVATRELRQRNDVQQRNPFGSDGAGDYEDAEDEFRSSPSSTGWDADDDDVDHDGDYQKIAYFNNSHSPSVAVVIPEFKRQEAQHNEKRKTASGRTRSSQSRRSTRRTPLSPVSTPLRRHTPSTADSRRHRTNTAGSRSSTSPVQTLQISVEDPQTQHKSLLPSRQPSKLSPVLEVPKPRPSDTLRRMGYTFAQENREAQSFILKSIQDKARELRKVREERKVQQQERLERFYRKVKKHGLEDFDNLYSDSDEEEDFSDDDDSISTQNLSKFHPLAVKAREREEKLKDRQRQRLKLQLEKQILKKAIALEKGQDLWGRK